MLLVRVNTGLSEEGENIGVLLGHGKMFSSKAMKAYTGSGYMAPHTLSLGPESASFPDRLTPGKEPLHPLR